MNLKIPEYLLDERWMKGGNGRSRRLKMKEKEYMKTEVLSNVCDIQNIQIERERGKAVITNRLIFRSIRLALK